MQKNALYSLAASLLALGAIGVNRTVPRLPPMQLHVVPIEDLARRIGTWTDGGDLSIESRVRELLPHARFVSRSYHDPTGKMVELLLETSPEIEEYHSPTICMPGQGWEIVRTFPTHVGAGQAAGGPSAVEMWMQLGDRKMVMLYWYTSERQLDKWQALKETFVAGRPPTRLFVRILAPVDSDFDAGSRTANAFGVALLPQIAALEQRNVAGQPPDERRFAR